jgi:DNA-directed RNA polymerase subunit N (RpoN/RPB10)
MIIPIKCFTCGTVLADKYRFYVERIKESKREETYFGKTTEKSLEGKLMDHLKLYKACCRRHMLTHIDIE